jgi:hypothetical protein
MSDIDNLLEELVKNIEKKLDDQQKELSNVKNDLELIRSIVGEKNDKYKNSLDTISYKIEITSLKIDETIQNIDLVQNGLISQVNKLTIDVQELKNSLPISNVVSKSVDLEPIKSELNKLQDQLNKIQTIEQKNVTSQPNSTVCTTNNPTDLTQLPAYNKSEMFKEIRRPVNLNELYMMVLQSTRTINELQMNVDNITRRN